MELTKWDLSEAVRKDRKFPWYLPSINKMFVKPMGRTSRELRPNKTPKTLQDPERLNFLLPSSYYYYPCCLYSAGVAELDLDVSTETDCSILQRDRTNTFIMADSGGYQVSVNQLEVDWDSPEPVLRKILKWQEHIANVGMHLDIPSRASEHEGSLFYGRPEACLEQSLQNFEFFEKEKQDEFELIMPIHGANIAEAINWYERVKHIPSCGWAVGAPLVKNYGNLLLLIDHIHRDGNFSKNRGRYFHIFGRGTGKDCIVSYVLQRTINKHINENTQVSFDASSPVKMGGRFGKVYMKEALSPTEHIVGQDSENFYNSIKGLNPKMPYPYASSPVLEAIHVEDILNPKSKSKYKMDGLSYSILASHNVFIAIQSAYGTLNSALHELAYITEQLKDSKKSGRRMSPYVSWNDISSKGDVGAWLFTLLGASDEVFKQKEHYMAVIVVEKWKKLFDEALNLPKGAEPEEYRYEYLLEEDA